ncbi:hypothetical protein [Psychrobacillus sp. FSL H8-0510]|uniref:hypothetical protein n=1 Tax=Psychrobacillus sp. FSL H8-0510 TaxID=2921394 RepID=UPI0030F70DC9
MMNKVIERISRDGILLQKHYSDSYQYGYHADKQMITYPALDNLQNPQNVFTLAHELGHHYQGQQGNSFFRIFSNLGRMKHLLGVICFVFVLWEEVQAWLIGWKICKEEHINTQGFWEIAIKSVLTYLKFFFIQLLGVGKAIVSLYIAIVFSIKFLLVSEELNLTQPQWLLDARGSLVSSSKSYGEVVSETFFIVLTTWVFTMLMFLGMRILIHISRR